MELWIIFAALTALALAALLWPLLRDGGGEGGGDVAVYADQLKELEAELARGQIEEREAEAARIEISRRLLAADERKQAEKRARRAPGRGRLAEARILMGAAIAVPALSLALYLSFGSPGLHDAPHAERMRAADSAETTPDGIARLVAQVEERLRAHPEDGLGWDVIAPVYARLGRFQDAAHAYRRANALLGETAGRLEGYGEARALADNGVVGENARKAFEGALKHDPDRPKSRFWLGVALEQDGRIAEAVAAWRALIANADERTPWRPFVEEQIAEAEAKLGKQPQAAKPKEPGPEEVAAAARMSADQRNAMINDMVEGLAGRLARNGNDLQGWLRLTRSYMVLGRRQQAREALETARANFEGDPKALAQLQSLKQELGL